MSNTHMDNESARLMARIAVSFYVGEACTVCGKAFDTVDSFKERNAVVVDPKLMSLACGSCYEKIERSE